MKAAADPRDWGLKTAENGELLVGGRKAVELARTYGTPLHVLNEARLEETARLFKREWERAFPEGGAVHYAFKCNGIPAVIENLRKAGLKAEVMSGLELDLAGRCGFAGRDIIVNGPGKTESFLRQCLDREVRFVILDSIEELHLASRLAASRGRFLDVLFRVNPDYTPQGMNSGSATAGRKGCAFGLDLKGGEAGRALRLLDGCPKVRFHGFHLHIGTGIADPKDYSRALRCLPELRDSARASGRPIRVLDIGGGFASPTSREYTGREMLLYQAFGLLPKGRRRRTPGPADFAAAIAAAVRSVFPAGERPEVLAEPGRSIAGPSQFLLLTVHQVKTRPGVRTWVVTDGGMGTVTLPTFYEHHDILVADDIRRPRAGKVTLIGPVCFAADVIYRHIRLPRLSPGETLAVMDSGAYFTSWESSFGFPRPAVVAVADGDVRLVRRRESFEDYTRRDEFNSRSES